MSCPLEQLGYAAQWAIFADEWTKDYRSMAIIATCFTLFFYSLNQTVKQIIPLHGFEASPRPIGQAWEGMDALKSPVQVYVPSECLVIHSCILMGKIPGRVYSRA